MTAKEVRGVERSTASDDGPRVDEIGAWIADRWLRRSPPNSLEAARWRVCMAAFWDATRSEPPLTERYPDRPQWDILTLRSALQNWGDHHEWCPRFRTIANKCTCGYSKALEIGQYATLDPDSHQARESLSEFIPPNDKPPFPDQRPEDAFSQAYFLITGRSPAWSERFGYAEAIQDIDDAQRLLRASVGGTAT